MKIALLTRILRPLALTVAHWVGTGVYGMYVDVVITRPYSMAYGFAWGMKGKNINER